MDTFEFNQERIDQYINKSMTEEEAGDFERDLASDETLHDQYRHTIATAQALRLEAVNARLTALQTYAASKGNNDNQGFSINKWLIAFGLLLLLVVLYYFWHSITGKPAKTMDSEMPTREVIDPNTTIIDTVKANQLREAILKDTIRAQKIKNNDGFASLAKKLFASPQNLALVTRSDKEDKNYETALKHYEQGRCSEAIKSLSNNKKDDPQNQYLQAHCLYQLREWSKAETIFVQFAEDEYSDYFQESKFYLALCYLNQMPQSKAKLKVLCEESIKSNSPYKAQFTKILQAINQ
jgi:Anaphase-promoting complex, cyclosome, subunit 3